MKAIVFAIALGLAAPLAHAAGSDEVIITAERYSSYESLQVPHVAIPKRADFAILTITVRSDTRDLSERLAEMRQALTNLESRTNASVALRLDDEEAGLVREFSVAAAMENLTGDGRPDTSRLDVLLRTPISAADTLDGVHKRFSAFVKAAPKPGRIEIAEGDLALTLTDPEQHRTALLTQIAADGKAASATIGPGYGVQVLGLERRIAWQRAGDLDLKIFLPYKLAVVPLPKQAPQP